LTEALILLLKAGSKHMITYEDGSGGEHFRLLAEEDKDGYSEPYMYVTVQTNYLDETCIAWMPSDALGPHTWAETTHHLQKGYSVRRMLEVVEQFRNAAQEALSNLNEDTLK
jgi:hypothetical protein